MLPALPRTFLVTGNVGHGSAGTGACNFVGQFRSEAKQPQATPQTQTIVLTQDPFNRCAPGTLCGGSVCLAPLFLEASAVEMIMPASGLGSTQASQGHWCSDPPSQALGSAAQLVPKVPPVNPGPWTHRAFCKVSMAAAQSKASLVAPATPTVCTKTCNSDSTSRPWPRGTFLSLDAKVLSCFLM